MGPQQYAPAPYKWCLNIPYSKRATCSIYFLQEFLLSSDAVSSYVYMWISQSLQITCASCLKRNDSVLSSISRRNVNQYSRIFLAKNEKQYIYMPALSVSPQQKRLICSKWRQSADTDDTVCADGERCSRCITTSENRRLEKLARRLADLYVEWAFCRETGANSVAEDLRLR